LAKSDFWFRFVFRVRYAEVDAQAIVFFGNYMSYFDTAHTEYMRALPFDYKNNVKRHNTDLHIVKVETEYHSPARFDDEIEVYVRTAYIGRSSMKVRFEVYPLEADTLLTSAQFVIVNADQATMQSVPWSKDLVRMIIGREITPVDRV
jgi:acyl-CoA thioester hydrolase